MAQTARYANRRGVSSIAARTRVYVDGNTVRKIQESPRSRRQLPQQRRRAVSKATRKNRAKAMSMTRGFVVFLTVVLIAILFSCVNYLHTKSQITAQMKSVAALESELTQLKEEKRRLLQSGDDFCGLELYQKNCHRRAGDEISF